MGKSVEEPKVAPKADGAEAPVSEPKVEPKADFFKLPDGLDLPEAAISVMNAVGKEWQGNVTKAMQKVSGENKQLESKVAELTRENVLNGEAAKAWEELMGNPEFIKVYNAIQSGETPQAQPAGQPAPSGVNYDDLEFGDSLKGFKQDLVAELVNEMDGRMDKKLQPVMAAIGQTKAQSDRAALQEYAKQVGGPDPADDAVAKRITYYQNRYKMSIEDAYDLMRGKTGSVKPPGNSGQDKQSVVGTTAENPVTIPPVGGAAVIVDPLRGKSALEAAKEERRSEKGGRKGLDVKGVMQKVVEAFTTKTGVKATLDDL